MTLNERGQELVKTAQALAADADDARLLLTKLELEAGDPGREDCAQAVAVATAAHQVLLAAIRRFEEVAQTVSDTAARH